VRETGAVLKVHRLLVCLSVCLCAGLVVVSNNISIYITVDLMIFTIAV